MRVLLISGHGNGDPGADGNGYVEANLTRELVNLVAPKLRSYASVDVYDQNRNAYEDVKAGKFSIGKYDYVLEVHFNAFQKSEVKDGKKKGTECYVTFSESGITVEQAIMKNMSKYFPLRDNDSIFDGVKRTNFAVIQSVKNRGISGALLETCFIDDLDDISTYQANKDGIATAIVEGIATGFSLNASNSQLAPTPTPPTNTEEFKHEVGEKVRFTTCYRSSNEASKCENYILASNMLRDTGTITDRRKVNGMSVYLLDGGLCWVNDGDIASSVATPKALAVGMKAKPKTAYSYEGVKLISSVVNNYYTVIQINGARVVLGDGLNTAFNISNLDY